MLTFCLTAVEAAEGVVGATTVGVEGVAAVEGEGLVVGGACPKRVLNATLPSPATAIWATTSTSRHLVLSTRRYADCTCNGEY